MKVLVAGGAGFIGSHLIDALLKDNNQVVCVDNFFIGTKANIEHLKDNDNFKFYELDLTDIEKLDEVFEKENIEYVFHLAANSDIQASANDPMIEYKNTYSTTACILECMRKHNVKKLFFSSTSAVYGNKTGIKLSEEGIDLKPISYYGAAKLGSEAIINAYTYMNDMSTLIFRFPNVIGPRLTHGVIFDFVKRLKEDPSHLRILGDGKQEKPYLHVYDLVDAIMKFKDVDKGITLYNAGVDSKSTVTRIAEIVCEKMNLKDIPFEYTGGIGGWKGDVPTFEYDLSKIHNAGWHASMSSDEAVEKTVESVI